MNHTDKEFEEKMMKELAESMEEERKKQEKQTKSTLVKVKKIVTKEQYKAIKKWLSDERNGIYGNLKIVDEPKGEWQNEVNEYSKSYWKILRGMYVDQYTGILGDDYSGYLAIKLPNGKYLQASFEL